MWHWIMLSRSLFLDTCVVLKIMIVEKMINLHISVFRQLVCVASSILHEWEMTWCYTNITFHFKKWWGQMNHSFEYKQHGLKCKNYCLWSWTGIVAMWPNPLIVIHNGIRSEDNSRSPFDCTSIGGTGLRWRLRIWSRIAFALFGTSIGTVWRRIWMMMNLIWIVVVTIIA